MKITSLLKRIVITIIEKTTRRKLILYPEHSEPLIFDKTTGVNLLPLRYSYRASQDNQVLYSLGVEGKNLTFTLFTTIFSKRLKQELGQQCMTFDIPSIKKGDVLKVSLTEFLVWHNDEPIKPTLFEHDPSRRFVAEINLLGEKGKLNRFCSHYLPYENKAIGRDYYYGDDYLSYPDQINVATGLNLVRSYRANGTLLDIGCALGMYTKGFIDAGYDAYGVDISEFAIAQAQAHGAPDHFLKCNIDQEEIPFALSFDIFWMWDVLEHSINPFKLLEKVSEKAKPGAYLFLHTSNSESLTHFIMGSDWEGYSDYSHYGVDQISATGLKRWLSKLGWEIREWKCNNIWVEGNDSTLLRLQDAFQSIPELVTLLSERNLGDALLVVARKISKDSGHFSE